MGRQGDKEKLPSPTTNYQLPTTNYQLPTTNAPSPIPNAQFSILPCDLIQNAASLLK
ncbi:MAG: hypothetical protein AAF630_00375 [Cyanobacteria bacterium P01_C01_bin.38]